jgi:hypothetical protein
MYAVFAWGSVVFPLFAMYDGRPFISIARYAVPVFPIFWATAALADRWKAREAIVAISAGLLTLLSVLAVASYPIF